MTKKTIRPRMVFADEQGQIYDHPSLLMLCRRGNDLGAPRPNELIPLPEESEFFLLPGRRALGLDPDTGVVEGLAEYAVAAFVRPGFTASGLAAYKADPGAPLLPIFSYAAIGYANGRFYVCANKVDADTRQIFQDIPQQRIQSGAQSLLKALPDNRLARHLAGCALTYCCPAARNLCLGRFEAPLPTARSCNARCVGCLSLQPGDSGFPATQERIAFAPDPGEISDIMFYHSAREKKRAIFSFGQGCEGEPLTEAKAIGQAIRMFRSGGGQGTVNINTNASLPQTMEELARSGLDSIRVSLNSARKDVYTAYYRPAGYVFEDVLETIGAAKKAGLFVSLNLLFFPGITDSEAELDALTGLVQDHHIDFIQLRNLNLDPELYLRLLGDMAANPSAGLVNFKRRLKKACPWLGFGYFNPFLGEE